MITQEQLDDAVLSVTGSREWDIFAQFLVNEAISARDSCADAKTWEAVQKAAGFAEGIAYVVNLREMTERTMEERDANV